MLRKKTITAKNAPTSLKPQKARQLIRRFHTLQKWKNSALKLLAKNRPEISAANYPTLLGKPYSDAVAAYKPSKPPATYQIDGSVPPAALAAIVAKIDAETAQRGGLHVYQMASTVGQDQRRGGDSSKWLVKWYQQRGRAAASALEIGCLSPHNCISTSGRFGAVTKIDLNSQHPQILQQNFMERPLPGSDADRFDAVSCSLVINFVPSAKERGSMLRRITRFLREPSQNGKSSLFLVLPLPCVANSRYFDRPLLGEIMASLGFEQIECHEAKKVIYLLYDWNGTKAMKKMAPRKQKEIFPGAKRNNFYIDMEK